MFVTEASSFNATLLYWQFGSLAVLDMLTFSDMCYYSLHIDVHTKSGNEQ